MMEEPVKLVFHIKKIYKIEIDKNKSKFQIEYKISQHSFR